MNIVKKNIKLIIGIIIGMLIVSAVSVYATVTYLCSAGEVSYSKQGVDNVETVAEALNDLYQKNYLAEVVWHNEEPDKKLEPMNIETDMTKYRSVIIMGFYSKDYKEYKGLLEINVGSTGSLNCVYNSDDITKRSIVVSSDKIQINEGHGWDDSVSNSVSIPTLIIGIK